MKLRLDQRQTRALLKALIIVAFSFVVLSLTANHIGLGHHPGFGWKKTALLIAGIPLTLICTWLLGTARTPGKLFSAAFAYIGTLAIAVGFAAHQLRIGHNPELRWIKAVLFIFGLGMVFVAIRLRPNSQKVHEIIRESLWYFGVVAILVAAAVHPLGLSLDPEFRLKRLVLLVFGLCCIGYAEQWLIQRYSSVIPQRWRHRLVFALLPFAIFFLNPNWPFQSLGHMDPWYYFGEFIHFPHYQRLSAGYPGERLMWILPGFALAHVLSPVYGLLTLHFLFYWIALGSLYSIVKHFTDSRTALISSLLLGCHPLFIGANGWSYLDGACIGYFLLSFAFLVKSTSSRFPALFLTLAGIWWASLVYTYILWLALTPCCVYLYYQISSPETRSSFSAILRHLAYFTTSFSAGFVILTAFLQGVHRLLYGAGHGFFFYNNVATAMYHATLEKSPWSSNNFQWIPTASWIVFPILVFLLCFGLLLEHRLRATELAAPAMVFIFIYLYCACFLVFMTVRPNHLLEFDYFASMLIPAAFLVLGLTVLKVPQNWQGARLYFPVAVCCAVCLAPLTKPNLYRMGLIHGMAFPYVIGLAAFGIRLAAWKRTLSWAVMLCFVSIATFPLTPNYPGLAWRAEYNGLASTRRIASAVELIERRLPSDAYPAFWINNVDGRFTAEYRAIMCSFQSHGLSMYEYPRLDKDRIYKPGTFLILITENNDVFDAANRTMKQAGMPVELYGQDHIAAGDDGVSYWITYVQVKTNESTIARK